MKIFIETERLILREILPTDVEGLFQLDSDPEVHRYLGNKTVDNKEQIIAMINFIRQQYIDNGIGRWAIIDKKSNNFMGWTGLKLIKELTNNHIDYYDLGYRLIPQYWGKGFATEAANASLNYGFEKLNLNEIYAMANCENLKSDRVLTKAGLRFIETFDLNGIKHNWYKNEKRDWTKRVMNCK